MAFDKNSITKIKETASLKEQIEKVVAIKKQGSSLFSTCVFHHENTPSMQINEEEGYYYCHGCGATGDVLTFMTEHHNLSFHEAVQRLAEEYKIKLPSDEQLEELDADYQAKEAIFLANAFAKAHYKEQLSKTATQFLQEKGLKEETIEQFEIGTSSGFHSLLEAAEKAAHSSPTLLDAKLLLNKEDKVMEFFYDERVIFPIHNPQGKTIAFAGRTLTEQEPKYLNLPNSKVYQKNQTLFGLHLAKRPMAKEEHCIIVEGYTDVMAMHQLGFKNTVGICGTALTQQHLCAIKKYTDTIVLLFDGDTAGQKATLKALPIILSEGLNVQIACLPLGKDPCDLIEQADIIYTILDEKKDEI